ncbi:MAG: hypothetical protein ACFFB0_08680 [Promethearchaeota archaeon]
MRYWKNKLKYDPITPLLSLENKAILYFSKRDLLNEKVDSLANLNKLPSPLIILNKQQENGSWKYLGGKKDLRTQEYYNQIETYRQIGILIEKYGFKKPNPAIKKAAEFLFSFQTEEGDFRGIYSNQYSPNYSAAIMELLIKAGYSTDTRIEKGFKWLLSVRQDDGGWAIPIRTHNAKWTEVMKSDKTLQPLKYKPFSHLVTGVVLIAFAAHPNYNERKEARRAGYLLASRFFQPDKYPDRRTKEYWTRVTFPFWFTDIISSLDSLSHLGFTPDHPQIKLAIEEISNRQLESGLFDFKLLKTKDKDLPYWIALAICRIFKNFY